MEPEKAYVLPELAYDTHALAPIISEAQLRLHYYQHHAAFVNEANAILHNMGNPVTENAGFDTKAIFKALSFQIGGHMLHSLFWENIAPPGKGGGENPSKTIAKVINDEFGSFGRFKKIFSQASVTAEGSQWIALTFNKKTNRPDIIQVDRFNTNIYSMCRILMVLDVWEHAYNIDYKNDRDKFIEAFWGIVNWHEVNNRVENLLKH